MNQIPDTKPGHYYISVIDANRTALLSGPYLDHSEALDHVEKARELAGRIDSKSIFYAFGTVRLDISENNTRGILNSIPEFKHLLHYSGVERRERGLQDRV